MNKMEHNGKVLSIHGIGGCLDDMDGSSGHHGSSSHFISVDEYGCIMLWMTSEGMQNNIDSEDTDSASFNMISSVYDFGLSPWSNVKLGLSRSLDSAMKMPSHANASTCSELDGADYDGECDRAGMNFALCLPIPGESASTFLVHTDHSRVRNTDSGLLGSHIGASTGIEKVVRLGQPSTPRYYVRFQSNHDVVDGAVVGSTGESSYTPCVLSMDVVHLVTTRGDHSGQCTAPPARDSSESKDDEETKGSDVADTNKPNFGRNATVSTLKLMLAGRYDGTVDLYDMNIAMPLITWKPSDYIQNRKSSVVEGTPIYCVRWITHTSFLVVDQGGIIYYYDLLQNLEVPTVVDNSIHNTIETNRKKKKNLTLIGVDISTDMKYINTIANNHNVYMVFYTNTTIKNESFMVRKLNEKLGSGLITENSGAHNQNPNALKNNIVVGDTYFVEEVLKPWITRLQQGDGSYKSARPMEDAHSHK